MRPDTGDPSDGDDGRPETVWRRVSIGVREDIEFALGHMVEDGVDLARPMLIRHYLHIADQGKSEALARMGELSAYSVEVLEPLEEEGADAEWVLRLSTTGSVSVEKLLAQRAELEPVTQQWGGAHDGWELSPDPSRPFAQRPVQPTCLVSLGALLVPGLE